MSDNKEQSIRVIICKENNVYIAQCLEYDIAAHGQTPEQAQRAFGELLIRHMIVARELQRAPFECLEPAPKQYWDLWDARQSEAHVRTPEPVSTSKNESIAAPSYRELICA